MPSTVPGLPPPSAGQPCPCSSGRPFEACCGPLLNGTQRPGTAEALMRSRFTAHVARDYAYLHRTHLPTAHRPYEGEDNDASPLAWSRLVIHSHQPGRDADHAFVDFTAYFRDDAGEHPMEERSEFVRENGQWLYARTVRSGPAPVRSSAPKVGRNDPCPCGSGKKYKHCCLKAAK